MIPYGSAPNFWGRNILPLSELFGEILLVKLRREKCGVFSLKLRVEICDNFFIKLRNCRLNCVI